MLYWLHLYSDQLSVLNVFRYGTFRAVGAAVTAMLICLFVGPWMIRKLRRLKLGQPIRGKDEVGEYAKLAETKKGTPTMGGLLMLFSIAISCVLWCQWDNRFIWLVLGSTLFLGLVGFADDYAKVRSKKSGGISGKQKLAAQCLTGLFVYFYLGYISVDNHEFTRLYIPLFKEPAIIDMGWGAAIFFSLVIMGTSNAVNLTDGLDGLAAGCALAVATTYAVFSYATGNEVYAKYLLLPHVKGAAELTIFCTALGGAGLGFLWYNCHPARVFMGDTGSLAIGGALAVTAICVHQELALVIAGGVFVMEAGSVLLQVASFKLTGKRIFAMSPLHHHFELKGWTESTVTTRFWILSLLFALLAVATLKLR